MKASEYVKQGWCQGVDAKDSTGEKVEVDDPRAVRWCVAGAMQAARCTVEDELALAAFIGFTPSVRSADRYWSLTVWNDRWGRTQQEVVDALEANGL